MLDSADLEQFYAYPADLSRPWLRTVFVSSIDGSATDRRGRSGALGSEVDAQAFALMRSLSDVILVAAGTTRAEGYEPVKPEEVDTRLRARLGLSALPPIAVVSARLDIPEALIAPGQLVITCTASPAARRQQLAQTMDVIVAGEDRVDLSLAVHALAERGWYRIVCEGGPTLHGELIAQDLVDEVCLTISPLLAAGSGPRIAHDPAFAGLPMQLSGLLETDDGLLSRWTRSPAN